MAHFETGIVLFFRHMMADKTLARSVHPNGREVNMGGVEDKDFVVFDESGEIIGIYPRDYIAAILPLVPAPAQANVPVTGGPHATN